MLSNTTDAACPTFSPNADGYVPAEGAVVLILQRLRDAKPGTVLAIIRGAEVQHVGRSNGLMAPRTEAQVNLLRTAYMKASIDPSRVQYLEVHGTGTQAGDASELTAVQNVFRKQKVILGSMKTLVGHTEEASGAVGMLKVLASFKHGMVPGNRLHGKVKTAPNYTISEYPSLLSSSARPIAGVSSFGAFGTISHIILEAPREEPPLQSIPDYGVLTLSAPTPSKLASLIDKYLDLVDKDIISHSTLAQMCYTSNIGRTHYKVRRALALDFRCPESILQTQLYDGLCAMKAAISPHQSPRLAILFTGQGSQYPRMGESLYQSNKIFKRAMHDCDAVVRRVANWSIVDTLYSDDESWMTSERLQPILIAYEISMVNFLLSIGLRANDVLGHSLGEIAAAYASNAFSLEAAMTLACQRGKILHQGAKVGSFSMLAAQISASKAEDLIFENEWHSLYIAGHNGPESVTISGMSEHLSALKAHLDETGIRSKFLPDIVLPFHSPHMVPAARKLRQWIQSNKTEHHQPSIPFYSTVTGDVVSKPLDEEYWYQHTVQTVEFHSAGTKLMETSPVCIEVGPKPILTNLMRARQVNAIHLQHDNVFAALSQLYNAGFDIDWQSVHESFASQHQIVQLPSYPWERQTFWPKANPERRGLFDKSTTANDALHWAVGKPTENPIDNSIIFEQTVQPQDIQFLFDHQINGKAVFPVAGFLDIIVSVGKTLDNRLEQRVENVEFIQPLVLTREASMTMFVVVDNNGSFKILARTNGHTAEYCRGSFAEYLGLDTNCMEPKDSMQLVDIYNVAQSFGFEYGPQFRNVSQVAISSSAVHAIVEAPLREKCSINPAVLDSCLHSRLAFQSDITPNALELPLAIKSFSIDMAVNGSSLEVIWDETQSLPYMSATCDGRPYLEIEGLVLQKGSPQEANSEDLQQPLTLKTVWQPRSVRPLLQTLPFKRAIIFSSDLTFEARVRAAAIKRGMTPVIVRPTFEQSRSFTNPDGSPVHFVHPLDDAAFENIVKGDSDSVLIYGWTFDSPTSLQWSYSAGLSIMKRLIEQSTPKSKCNAIWIVHNALALQNVDISEVRCEDNAILGLVKAFRTELGDRGNVMALDLPTVADNVDVVWDHLALQQMGDRSSPIIYREMDDSMQAFVPVATTFDRTSRGTSSVRAMSGTFIITGGMGDVAADILEWLAKETLISTFVIIGRRSEAEVSKRLAFMRQSVHAKIIYYQGDISSHSKIQSIVNDIGLEMITGIVHCAGVLSDASLANQSWKKFQDVSRAKVDGSRVLHEMSLQMANLQSFILISSIASLMGGPAGLSNYIAANHYIESLATLRASQQLPVKVIQLGAWENSSMAKRTVGFFAKNLPSLSMGDASDSLRAVLESSEPIVAIANVNIVEFAKHAPYSSDPFLSTLFLEHSNQEGSSVLNSIDQSKMSSNLPVKVKVVEVAAKSSKSCPSPDCLLPPTPIHSAPPSPFLTEAAVSVPVPATRVMDHSKAILPLKVSPSIESLRKLPLPQRRKASLPINNSLAVSPSLQRQYSLPINNPPPASQFMQRKASAPAVQTHAFSHSFDSSIPSPSGESFVSHHSSHTSVSAHSPTKETSRRQTVIEVFKKVLQITDQKIDESDRLASYGFDSLYFAEFVALVRSKLEVSIPASYFAGDRTLEEIIQWVEGQP